MTKKIEKDIICDLSILQFALIKQGKIDSISIKRKYSGYMDPIKNDDMYNTNLDLDEKYTLQEVSDGAWIVGYGEKGNNNIIGIFPRVREAVGYVYWLITKDTIIGSPWEYREEWEAATGMSY